MTFPAALAVHAATGRPLVVHVHSTEYDRAETTPDPRIVDVEHRALHAATRVVAVSHLTKSLLAHHYGVDPAKVDVVYNAVDLNGIGDPNGIGAMRPTSAADAADRRRVRPEERIVLFLGRITMQKGPEYFVAAARRVLGVMPDVRFIMAGTGDQVRRTIELAASMGIGHRVLFTGFLRPEDVREVFERADCYVMPSVSEPFGIAPLEAIAADVPTIISRQSGVAEVLHNVLKVDFWDVEDMADKIVSVLRRPALSEALRHHGAFEVRKLTWSDAAATCLRVYDVALNFACAGAAAH